MENYSNYLNWAKDVLVGIGSGLGIIGVIYLAEWILAHNPENKKK